MRRTTTHQLIILTLVCGLLGCAGSNIPDAKSTTGRDPSVAEVPNADETVRGADDPAITTLDLGSVLHEHRLSESDDLPGNIVVPTTNLNAVPITAALQAVLSGTDVSLSWDTGALGDRLVTVMNVSGSLPKVVDKICSAARVFCAYRHGTLELQEKETFVVSLPPIPKPTGSSSASGGSSGTSTTNSMVEAMNQLVGSKVQVDDQGGNVIYTTDVEGESRVQRYLEQLRNGRPLVVLQMYVWEVTLNKENSEGINWSALKLNNIGPGAEKTSLSSLSSLTTVASNPGSISLGAVTSGHLDITALAGFLSTQGRIQTISSPQVTFVSGSNAELKVGGTQRYISQVGQLVSATNVSGTSTPNPTAGVGTNTINTDSIDTGLTINVAGAYENDVVFANLDIAIKNLVSLNPTTSEGVTIDLPQTTDEKMSTVIRVRPGDNLVMAGLVTSADTNSRQGLPLGEEARLPMYGDDLLQNHELVIVIKPSVVLFSDKPSTLEANKKKEPAKPYPEAVYIDKDGSKPLTVPATQDNTGTSTPLALAPAAAPTTEMEATSPFVGAPSSDGAVVDRRLMQRGFSHAFDDLLKPPSTPLVQGSNEGTP